MNVLGTIRRLAVLLAIIVIGIALVTAYGSPQGWLADQVSRVSERTGIDWLLNLQKPVEVPLRDLPAYTRAVAGEAQFREDFLRLTFGDADDYEPPSSRITKWDKRRVTVDILNADEPEMTAYLRQLIKRLNAIQGATIFTLVEDGAADITIRFISRERYKSEFPGTSVGYCMASYYVGRPGLISAAITIDGETLATTERRKPVFIHELTHALGFRGHLRKPGDRTRSVLYYTPAISQWSRDDEAAIRILYSSEVKSGLGVRGVRRALDRIATGSQP